MDAEMEHLNPMNISPSKVPDGWFVEQRLRVSNPNHIDKVTLLSIPVNLMFHACMHLCTSYS